MFKELVMKSRTFRAFDESYRFTEEELRNLIDTARYAPAATNAQPLKYRLVFEKEELSLVRPLIRMGGALPELHLPREGECPTAYVVICHDTRIVPINDFYTLDCGIAAQTIMLAASEKGLGGCMIASFDRGKLREALSVPGEYEPRLLLALGKPIETVRIVEIDDGESTKYYRNEEGIHFVPKRKLSDILI